MKADNNINLYTFTVEVPAGKTVQSYFPLARGIYFRSVKDAGGLAVPIRAHFSRDDNTQGQLCTVIEGYSVFNPDNSFNCVVFLNEQTTTVTVTCSVSNGQIQYMPVAVELPTVVSVGAFTGGTTAPVAPLLSTRNTKYVFSYSGTGIQDLMILPAGCVIKRLEASGQFVIVDNGITYTLSSAVTGRAFDYDSPVYTVTTAGAKIQFIPSGASLYIAVVIN